MATQEGSAVSRPGASHDPARVARDVIHRCNNFLSFVVVLGENAVSRKDGAALEEALRSILKETAELEEFLKQSRQTLES